MNRKRLISIIILGALAFLNSGCVQKVFNENKDIKKKDIIKPVAVTPTMETPDAECINEVSTPKKSNCDRGKISTKDLNSRPKKGEKHTLKSIRGKVVYISERPNGFIFPQYRGKVMILTMFGKDCPHCINEIPVIDKIRKRYRGKLEVLAIQSQERMSKFVARNYINKYKIRYPIIEGEDATNLQYFIQETYGWRGILPYTLVIKDGITEFSYSGEVLYSELEEDIDSLF